MDSKANIQEVNQNFTKEFLLSGEYPEVCGTAYGAGYLVLHLRKASQREFPKEYHGFPVRIEIIGEIKPLDCAHEQPDSKVCTCDSDPGDCHCSACGR